MNKVAEKNSLYYTKFIVIAIIAIIGVLAICGVSFAENVISYVFIAPLAVPMLVAVFTGGVPGILLYLLGIIIKLCILIFMCNMFVKLIMMISGKRRAHSKTHIA
jgi:hypothetical protein